VASVHHVLTSPDVRSEVASWSPSTLLDWREWDGEVVVRSGADGATYLLSPLAGRVLRALLQGAADADDIARHVSVAAARPSAATAALSALFVQHGVDTRQVAAALADLESLGLVRANLSSR
jgi:hypothetical protein